MITRTIREYDIACGNDEMNCAELVSALEVLSDMVEGADLACVNIELMPFNVVRLTVTEVDMP